MTGENEIERLMRLALRKIRPRFEMWAAVNGFDIKQVDKGEPESKYKSDITQAAFEGWVGAMFDQSNDEKGAKWE
jgi:hypothetical protein